MKTGILRETKQPPDRRVPLTPHHVKELGTAYPDHQFTVQSSPIRVFSDEEYRKESVQVKDDLDNCDLLLGVKEVALDKFLPDKTYLIFSHTAKEQPQNQKLLQKLSALKCTLIDYEYLTHNEVRVVAFGYWAGIVGAYNALLAYGLESGLYELKPPQECLDLDEMRKELLKVKYNRAMHIVITGEGRVASGASEILSAAGIQRVTPKDFLLHAGDENIYCHTGPQHYTRHFANKKFDFDHFIHHPGDYESNFTSFAHKANILVACHFWDNRSPHFFTTLDLQNPEFRIRLISDISCDIPGPIPTTLRTSIIDSPFYGVKRSDCTEIPAFDPDQITVAAVDNLPSALPRDASEDFGDALVRSVIPHLLSEEDNEIIEGATILKEGKLTPKFSYLKNYLEGVG